ncbi:MaoC/PaaZ C-terminal domain-containing protein [Pandoraea sp. SD6-2]|uniref:MaoC/PaaZ C-terminal domain-containing protein n=1 Tax=Pandoraea sp. SD6-2 TaxID=1286093 RepID=UPI00039F3207|nr:MaoC/PaaZ C-terminal domain-containing protein [Pandoraea sp. SD6-2]
MANDRPRDPQDTVPPATPTEQTAINVTRPPSPLHLYLRALLSSRKPALAQSLPPLAFGRRNVALDAAGIARYARLCGFTDAHGVPPTWPHLLAFPLHMLLMTDRAFPFAMLGMVHLANRVRTHAPLAVGDRLDLDVRCGPLYAHDKGQVFTVLTTARRAGEVVWSGESLYLRTGVRAPLGAPYRAELSAGPSLVKTATWRVPGDLGRQYARVSGDYNPIHLWPITAKWFGFPRPIIHGMWSFARTLAAVLPADERCLDLLVEFKTPLLLPGEATLWCDPHRSVVELRDAAGAVPHLRARWQAAPGASPAINTFATDPS